MSRNVLIREDEEEEFKLSNIWSDVSSGRQQGLTLRTDHLLDLSISDPVAPAQVQQPQTGQGGRDQGRQTGPGQTRHPELPQTWTDGHTHQHHLMLTCCFRYCNTVLLLYVFYAILNIKNKSYWKVITKLYIHNISIGRNCNLHITALKKHLPEVTYLIMSHDFPTYSVL